MSETVTISIWEYEDFLKNKERLSIIRDYVNSTEYVDVNVLKILCKENTEEGE